MEIMTFLWILFLLLFICPPVGIIICLLVGFVGLLAAPIVIFLAWRSDHDMWSDDDDEDDF